MCSQRTHKRILVPVFLPILSMALSGCLSDEESPWAMSTQPTANSAPQISGTPSPDVNVDGNYAFMPIASDANGDTLTFSITGLPPWASFNFSTGQISGTPTDGDIGTYSNVSVTVSDGQASASLLPFSITVRAMSPGSVTLSWNIPTENQNGSVLTDLDSYKIYWGTGSGNYPNSITIDNVSISTHVLENLSPGNYEFVATAFNASGVESDYSIPTTRVVE